MTTSRLTEESIKGMTAAEIVAASVAVPVKPPSTRTAEEKQELQKSLQDRIQAMGIGKRLHSQRYPPKLDLKLRKVVIGKENLKGSVLKLNMVARLIRRLPVPEAMLQLRYCRKVRSHDFMVMIKHGCEVAKEKMGLEPHELNVAIVNLGRGPFLKRIDIKGRGRSGLLTLPYTHVEIELREIARDHHFEEQGIEFVDPRANADGKIVARRRKHRGPYDPKKYNGIYVIKDDQWKKYKEDAPRDFVFSSNELEDVDPSKSVDYHCAGPRARFAPAAEQSPPADRGALQPRCATAVVIFPSATDPSAHLHAARDWIGFGWPPELVRAGGRAVCGNAVRLVCELRIGSHGVSRTGLGSAARAKQVRKMSNTIIEQQKSFQKGATPYLRGDVDPTYLRKSSDGPVAAGFLGIAIVGWGVLGYKLYRLAEGKK
ncbi:50S ribosomal protein L22 [Durusdinium trenchii]|uniref:50S ribosomal protein L22 n=1 Tax=Durusdinium trenchii TaxID=1381693 RepID=A0ABP0JZX1_9DINO